MGKLKSVLEDWLDNYGHELGYDMTNYPSMEDWDNIRIKKIDAREYYENYRIGSNRKTRK